ncbi:MAG: flagellar biosynthesis anti-sigma factor FlgM [Flavobacteriales bacterium]
MRIERLPGGIAKVDSSSGKKNTRSKKAVDGSSVTVSVANSSELREKALSMYADLSAVRVDEIDAIREKIANGDYEIDEKKIAAKIVSNALLERPWL